MALLIVKKLGLILSRLAEDILGPLLLEWYGSPNSLKLCLILSRGSRYDTISHTDSRQLFYLENRYKDVICFYKVTLISF